MSKDPTQNLTHDSGHAHVDAVVKDISFAIGPFADLLRAKRLTFLCMRYLNTKPGPRAFDPESKVVYTALIVDDEHQKTGARGIAEWLNFEAGNPCCVNPDKSFLEDIARLANPGGSSDLVDVFARSSEQAIAEVHRCESAAAEAPSWFWARPGYWQRKTFGRIMRDTQDLLDWRMALIRG